MKNSVKNSASRISYTLRLQPYENTLLGEVVNFLNSLDSDMDKRLVEGILIMCLLPQARQKLGSWSQEEIRLSFFETRDLMEKHLSNTRQALRIEPPYYPMAYAVPIGDGIFQPPLQPPSSPSLPSNIIQSPSQENEVSSADLDAMFGGDDDDILFQDEQDS